MRNKRILILGMARSGVAISKLLSQYDNDITLTDLKEQSSSLVKELENLGIHIVITDHQEDLVNDTFDIVIKNPAIPKNNPAVIKAKELQIPVINELEASYELLPKNVTIIGITGSNGKTTTTTMTYEMLKRSNHKVHLAGNIGIPLADIVSDVKEGDIIVLEISDHQLMDMYDFTTNIGVLTNLSEVHLDFHGSYENYKNIKKKIFANHTKDSIAILNAGNKDILERTQNIPSKKIYFSAKEKADICLEEGDIVYNEEKIISTKDIRVKGNHNYENSMVAILIAKMFDVTNEDITKYLKEFKGVEHRIEYVTTLNGRKFYNDSKATNNESTIIALDSFTESTILIMGGLDRNIPFDSIAPHLIHTKKIICYGETKEKIKELGELNGKEVLVTETLEEATKLAYQESAEGDVILLSPACASWDQFDNFETRGQIFKEVVKKL